MIKKHRYFIFLFAASALLIASASAAAWVRLRGIREPLILHYSPYTGIDQIGGVGDLLGVGLSGLVLVAVNALLAFALAEREKLWAEFVALMTLLLAALLFIAFLAIISVNS